jgi:outer membrane protein assembly factor BamA
MASSTLVRAGYVCTRRRYHVPFGVRLTPPPGRAKRVHCQGVRPVNLPVRCLSCQRARSLALSAALLAGCLAWPAPAQGQAVDLTPFEQRTVEEAAASRRLPPEIDPEPEGKRIESIDVVVVDVFDQHDPVPDFFNLFHTTTRQVVVRRELLFMAGEGYSARQIDETARNLRNLRQLSLVLIVPLRGSAPDRVRVLVIVKDVWSLRMNSDFSYSNAGLGYLVLNPSEENLAGTHVTLGALFRLDPGSFSLGGIVTDRRLFGTDLEAVIGMNLIYNRDSGRAEGSYGYFSYGAPIRSSADEWGWGTGMYFRHEVARRFRGGELETYDAPSTPRDDALPVIYRAERISAAAEVDRSFGTRDKFDIGVGLEAERRAYRYQPPPGTVASAERDFLRKWVPVSDTRIGPYVQLYVHSERYLRTVELETLGLQEDYRLGPEVTLRLSTTSSELGSSRSLVSIGAGAAYTLALGDGLLRALFNNSIQYAANGQHDAAYAGRLRLASPRFGFGRLIADAVIAERYRNYLNGRYVLGGDERLRGYPPATFEDSFTGAHLVAMNLEFRTASIDILSAQTGLALFLDSGHAADRFAALSLHQSSGIGVRILFPQASRSVLRADWAFPWRPAPGYQTFPGGFFLSFGQAFGMPQLYTGSIANPETFLSTVAQ